MYYSFHLILSLPTYIEIELKHLIEDISLDRKTSSSYHLVTPSAFEQYK
jgi:hypothetical protein